MRKHKTDLMDWKRCSLGFDNFFDHFEDVINSGTADYIPYNIVKVDDILTRVELAVAGFNYDEISIIVENDQLTISGEKKQEENGDTYIHKGIADRPFTKIFQMADHMAVLDAIFNSGILTITARMNIPKELQRRNVEIRVEDK